MAAPSTRNIVPLLPQTQKLPPVVKVILQAVNRASVY